MFKSLGRSTFFLLLAQTLAQAGIYQGGGGPVRPTPAPVPCQYHLKTLDKIAAELLQLAGEPLIKDPPPKSWKDSFRREKYDPAREFRFALLDRVGQITSLVGNFPAVTINVFDSHRTVLTQLLEARRANFSVVSALKELIERHDANPDINFGSPSQPDIIKIALQMHDFDSAEYLLNYRFQKLAEFKEFSYDTLRYSGNLFDIAVNHQAPQKILDLIERIAELSPLLWRYSPTQDAYTVALIDQPQLALDLINRDKLKLSRAILDLALIRNPPVALTLLRGKAQSLIFDRNFAGSTLLQTLLIIKMPERKIPEDQMLEYVAALVEMHVPTKTVNAEGQTALSLAISNGYFEVARYLIKNTDTVDVRTSTGNLMDIALSVNAPESFIDDLFEERFHASEAGLIAAIKKVNLKAIKTLVEELQAPITDRVMLAAAEDLSTVASKGIERTIHALLPEEHKQMLNQEKGLQWNVQMLTYFAKKGGNLSASDESGKNVLMKVSEGKDRLELYEALKALINRGATYNAPSTTGDTVLMLRIKAKDWTAVRYLLRLPGILTNKDLNIEAPADVLEILKTKQN